MLKDAYNYKQKHNVEVWHDVGNFYFLKSKESKTVLSRESVKQYKADLACCTWNDLEKMMIAIDQLYVVTYDSEIGRKLSLNLLLWPKRVQVLP